MVDNTSNEEFFFAKHKNANPDDPNWLWQRNVLDKYKPLSTEEIRADLKKNALNCGIMMVRIFGDFNFGTLIRNANSFGCVNIFYHGKKRIDKRSACGVLNYSDVQFLSTVEDIIKLKEQYYFIGLENNVPNTVPLNTFQYPTDKPPMFILGEESCGLSEDIMKLMDFLVEIPSRGSVRSLNVGTASGIVLYDFASKMV